MSWPAAALAHWGLTGDIGEPIMRENTVWRIDCADGPLALRRHRPGYRTIAELRSELEWMEMLADWGLPVPAPVSTPNGVKLAEVEGYQASLLTWLLGEQMGRTGEPLSLDAPLDAFRALGEAMARLHDASDRWTPPPGFTRWSWDRDGLVGEAPVWGRFWEAPFLSPDERASMLRLRDAGREALGDLDNGLIHADLLRENVLLHEGRPQILDFDDGGWGPRLFDVATSLVKNIDEPIYPELQAALLDGYRSRRPIDTAALPLMLALRAATYLGWLADRWDEPGAAQRAARNTDAAMRLTAAALETV